MKNDRSRPFEGPLEEDLPDRGGMRSGDDRRKHDLPFEGRERRSGRDRRRGFDRRSGIDRRRFADRRAERLFTAGERIERRDALRRLVGGI